MFRGFGGILGVWVVWSWGVFGKMRGYLGCLMVEKFLDGVRCLGDKW